MRKSLVAVAALTTVASGCGEYNFTPVPTCKANEFLTGDGKALKCVEVKVENPTPMVQDMAMPPPPPMDLAMMAQPPPIKVPSCLNNEVLTGKAGELSCVDVSKVNQTIIQVVADLMKVFTQLDDHEQRLKKLEMMMGGGGGGIATFAGVTKYTSPGLITKPNFDNGLVAAAARCTDEYGAGAHMCTVGEIYQSVITGKVVSGKPSPKAWVYAPSWQRAAMTGSSHPLLGVSDNCAGYTYPTGDQGFAGVAFEWGPSPAKNQAATYVPLWHGGSMNAACSAVLPIACCK